MTDHIINYINDLRFRQSIQGALCRGEAYHQLRRYIERVNGRHFRGATETQIAIWNECARLLANCVIYYNACILDRWKEKSLREGNTELAELIKRLSPVAWTHLNFQGRFQFLSSYEAMDIDALLQTINVTADDF